MVPSSERNPGMEPLCLLTGRSTYQCGYIDGDAFAVHDIHIIEKRKQAIYREDAGKPKRKSHENEMVMKLYREFIGEPYGEKAHNLLHTSYTPRAMI